MTHQLVTKTVAACLIPCVLLYAIGCGTSRQSTTSLKDLDKDATIIVWTTQGQFHRLLKWEADEKANITGAGSTFTSLEAANSDAMGSPFNGTIMASQITAIYEYSRMITSEVTGERKYSNFTKITGMLEGIRHYNPRTYQRRQYLAKDIDQKGPLYAYLKDTFGLTGPQLQQATNNIKQAAGILYASCKAKKLRFDLDPDTFFLEGKVESKPAQCEPVRELTP